MLEYRIEVVRKGIEVLENSPQPFSKRKQRIYNKIIKDQRRIFKRLLDFKRSFNPQ